MVSGLSSYSSLNGLGLITGGTSGYGYGYGYGGYGMANETYVANAKKSIANNYDLSTTRQAYANKQATEENAATISCQSIRDMLQDGRTDDALGAFNNLVETYAQLPQYQGYTEDQLKGLVHNDYIAATKGTTLLADISANADSSFMTGLKNSNPISIFLSQSSSAADMKAEATGQPVAKTAVAAKVAGAATGGALFAGGAVALHTGCQAARALGNNATLVSKLGTAGTAILSKVRNAKWSGVKQVAIAGAIIGVVCLGAKWLFNKVSGTTDSKAAQA